MSRRARGEGSIFQRQDGYWCASARLPSGKRIVRYRRTKQEAAAALVALRTETGLVPPPPVTVATWLDQWLELRRVALRPRTLRNYRSVVHAYLQPAFGAVLLTDLPPLQVEQLIVRIAEAHPFQARVVLNVLRSACAHAVRLRYLAVNPAAVVPLPPAEPRPRVRWDAAQLATFLEASQQERESALWALVTRRPRVQARQATPHEDFPL